MRVFKTFLVAAAIVFDLLNCGALAGADTDSKSGTGDSVEKDTLVYIGTYTGGESKGIYRFRLQPQGTEVFQNVTLVPLGLAAETPNPSFLEIDLKRRLLFAVNEIDEFEGKPTGTVSAFSIDPAGNLTLLNQRSSMGARPCHLALDSEGRNLLVANCGADSVAVVPVASDGQLGQATEVVRYAGKSVDPQGQAAPHHLGVALDPAGRFAFVCDLGSDKINVYAFDPAAGKLSPHEGASPSVEAGSGPRAMVFRPDGRFAYVLNEFKSSVDVFAYDAEGGVLSPVQNATTLPGYFDGPNSAAGIAMHPSGKYLFVSNDGHNSVVLFTIDPSDGTLNWVEEQGTGGAKPRHFGIEPAGKHMAISNLGANTILASRIDASNGRLKPSGIFAELTSPASVRFLPPVEAGK